MHHLGCFVHCWLSIRKTQTYVSILLIKRSRMGDYYFQQFSMLNLDYLINDHGNQLLLHNDVDAGVKQREDVIFCTGFQNKTSNEFVYLYHVYVVSEKIREINQFVENTERTCQLSGGDLGTLVFHTGNKVNTFSRSIDAIEIYRYFSIIYM